MGAEHRAVCHEDQRDQQHPGRGRPGKAKYFSSKRKLVNGELIETRGEAVPKKAFKPGF